MLPAERDCIAKNLPHLDEPILTRAVLTITDNLQRFRASPIPQLPLEITILEILADQSEQSPQEKLSA
ncbi:MAG: hypothetical protein AAB539_00675 [Patescibacteria group bacterium]